MRAGPKTAPLDRPIAAVDAPERLAGARVVPFIERFIRVPNGTGAKKPFCRLEDGADQDAAPPLIREVCSRAPSAVTPPMGLQSLIAGLDEAPSRASFRPIRPAVPVSVRGAAKAPTSSAVTS